MSSRRSFKDKQNIQPMVNAFINVEDSETPSSEDSAPGTATKALTIRPMMQLLHRMPNAMMPMTPLLGNDRRANVGLLWRMPTKVEIARVEAEVTKDTSLPTPYAKSWRRLAAMQHNQPKVNVVKTSHISEAMEAPEKVQSILRSLDGSALKALKRRPTTQAMHKTLPMVKPTSMPGLRARGDAIGATVELMEDESFIVGDVCIGTGMVNYVCVN